MRATPLIILIAMLAGCEAADSNAEGGWAGTIDTLDGGIIIVANPTSPLWQDSERWRLEEDLRIGTIEGDGPETFGRIAALAVDGRGRIHVLDQRAREVRVFGPDGAHVRTVGSSGEGPGELRNPFGLTVGSDDTIWIVDPGNARYTVFDSTGRLGGVHRRPIGFFSVPWPGGFDEDGSLFDVALTPAGEPTLVRLTPDMQVADTIPMPSHRVDQITVARADGTPVMSFPDPFAPRLVWQFDRRGSIWSAITEQYELVQAAFSGDTMRVVRRELPRVSVSEREADSALAATRELVQSASAGARADRQPRIPREKPALNAFYIDTEGYLWVEPAVTRGALRQLDVFDPVGRYMGSVALGVEIERHPQPVFTRSAIYAVVTDALDVPYVVRLRITGR